MIIDKMPDMASSSLGVIFAYIFVVTNFGLHREDRSCEASYELNLKGLKLERKLKVYLAVIFIFALEIHPIHFYF